MLFLLPSLLLADCAFYHPLPLNTLSIETATQLTDTLHIRELVAKINHPILQPVPFNLEDGLSPDEATILAVLANPFLIAERDKIAVADAQLLQAGILPNPVLSVSMDIPTSKDNSGKSLGLGYREGWDVLSLLNRPAKISSARAHATSVELGIAWKEWQVAESAKLSAYRMILDEQRISLTDSLRMLCRLMLDSACSYGLKIRSSLVAGIPTPLSSTCTKSIFGPTDTATDT